MTTEFKPFEILTCRVDYDTAARKHDAVYCYAVAHVDSVNEQGVPAAADCAPFVAEYSSAKDEITYFVNDKALRPETVEKLKAHFTKEHVKSDGTILTIEFARDHKEYPNGLGTCKFGTIIYFGDNDWALDD